jgi:hypothetical protein
MGMPIGAEEVNINSPSLGICGGEEEKDEDE